MVVVHIFWGLRGSAKNAYLVYRGDIHRYKRNKMYWVPNETSRLQFLESLSTPIMTFKKRKSQQLINTSAVSAPSENKISNYIPLPSFDSRMSHQRRVEIWNVQATPIPKSTLATNFPLILEGEYHQFVTSKPRVPCQLCMCNGRYMEDRMLEQKKKLNQNWGGKASHMCR